MKNVLAVFIGMCLFELVNGAIVGYVSGLPSYLQEQEMTSLSMGILLAAIVIYAVLCMRGKRDESKPREVSSKG